MCYKYLEEIPQKNLDDFTFCKINRGRQSPTLYAKNKKDDSIYFLRDFSPYTYSAWFSPLDDEEQFVFVHSKVIKINVAEMIKHHKIYFDTYPVAEYTYESPFFDEKHLFSVKAAQAFRSLLSNNPFTLVFNNEKCKPRKAYYQLNLVGGGLKKTIELSGDHTFSYLNYEICDIFDFDIYFHLSVFHIGDALAICDTHRNHSTYYDEILEETETKLDEIFKHYRQIEYVYNFFAQNKIRITAKPSYREVD